MNLFNKYSLPIFIVFLGTIIGNVSGNFFPAYPQVVKIIFGLSIYLSILTLSGRIVKHNFNYLNKREKVIFILILLLSLVSIVRGILSNNVLAGNKFTTLFFNPVFVPIFLLPIYSLYVSFNNLRYLIAYIILNIILLFGIVVFHGVSLKLIVCASIIYPIVKRKYKILIVLFACLCVYVNVPGVELLGGGTRKLLICVLFFLLSYVVVYIIENRRILLIFSYIVTIFPLFTLYDSISKGDSIFAELTTRLSSSKNTNSFKVDDTRTFLYTELLDDILRNNSLFFGKGSYSTYYSTYFDRDNIENGDSSSRVVVEVTFLHYFFRAGIFYVLLLVLIIQTAVYKALLKSNSNWLKYVALILNGFYLNCFVGDFNGFDLTSVIIWIFIGICLQERWLLLSDKQIFTYIKGYQKSKKYT